MDYRTVSDPIVFLLKRGVIFKSKRNSTISGGGLGRGLSGNLRRAAKNRVRAGPREHPTSHRRD